MNRRIYVDMENVNVQAISQIDKLTQSDEVYIIYSDASGKMTFDMAAKLVQNKALIKLIKVTSVGTNALDYRLVALLGSHVANNKSKNDEFYIVSIDKGYLAALNILSDNAPATKLSLVDNIDRIIHPQEEMKL